MHFFYELYRISHWMRSGKVHAIVCTNSVSFVCATPCQGLSLAAHGARSLYSSAPAGRPGELGLAIARLSKGIVVSDKKTDSPAAYSQTIRVGDRILKVDGIVVEHMEVAQVRRLLSGPPYTTVELELASSDTGAPYTCALQRAEATVWSSRDPTPISSAWDSTWEATSRLKGEGDGDMRSTAGSQYGGDATTGLYPSLDLSDWSLNIFNTREKSAPSTPVGTAPSKERTKNVDPTQGLITHANQSNASILTGCPKSPKATLEGTRGNTGGNTKATLEGTRDLGTRDLMPRVIRPISAAMANPTSKGSSAELMSPVIHGAIGAGDVMRVPSFPESLPSMPLTPRPIGLLLAKHAHSGDPEAVVIDKIMPNSTADLSSAKIMTGDELVSVNGTQVRHMPLGSVRSMMVLDHVNRRLVLELKRGETIYTTELIAGETKRPSSPPLTDMPAETLKAHSSAASLSGEKTGGAVNVVLKLGLDIGAAGVEGSRWREGFLQVMMMTVVCL